MLFGQGGRPHRAGAGICGRGHDVVVPRPTYFFSADRKWAVRLSAAGPVRERRNPNALNALIPFLHLLKGLQAVGS